MYRLCIYLFIYFILFIFLFKRIIYIFHSLQNLDLNTKLTAANGTKVEALVVFSLSIKYLADKAVEIIRERTGDNSYTANEIQWVITVPAIWTPAAKQFMREAAYKVGCPPLPCNLRSIETLTINTVAVQKQTKQLSLKNSHNQANKCSV